MKIYNPIVGYKTNKQIKKRGRSAKSKLNQKRLNAIMIKYPECLKIRWFRMLIRMQWFQNIFQKRRRQLLMMRPMVLDDYLFPRPNEKNRIYFFKRFGKIRKLYNMKKCIIAQWKTQKFFQREWNHYIQ